MSSALAISGGPRRTVGEVAASLDVPVGWVERAVRSRQIQPIGYEAGMPLFDDAGLDLVLAYIREEFVFRVEIAPPRRR